MQIKSNFIKGFRMYEDIMFDGVQLNPYVTKEFHNMDELIEIDHNTKDIIRRKKFINNRNNFGCKHDYPHGVYLEIEYLKNGIYYESTCVEIYNVETIYTHLIPNSYHFGDYSELPTKKLRINHYNGSKVNELDISLTIRDSDSIKINIGEGKVYIPCLTYKDTLLSINLVSKPFHHMSSRDPYYQLLYYKYRKDKYEYSGAQHYLYLKKNINNIKRELEGKKFMHLPKRFKELLSTQYKSLDKDVPLSCTRKNYDFRDFPTRFFYILNVEMLINNVSFILKDTSGFVHTLDIGYELLKIKYEDVKSKSYENGIKPFINLT